MQNAHLSAGIVELVISEGCVSRPHNLQVDGEPTPREALLEVQMKIELIHSHVWQTTSSSIASLAI